MPCGRVRRALLKEAVESKSDNEGEGGRGDKSGKSWRRRSLTRLPISYLFQNRQKRNVAVLFCCTLLRCVFYLCVLQCVSVYALTCRLEDPWVQQFQFPLAGDGKQTSIDHIIYCFKARLFFCIC